MARIRGSRRSLLAAVVLAASLRGAASGQTAAVSITILHTSDLHGRVHPWDALADADAGQGLARVAAAVAAVRAEGRPVLLLDSGDTIEGAPEEALQFPAGSDPIILAMNRVGYDAMAVGNHEFDFGRTRLEASRRQASFPFLSANTVEDGGAAAFEGHVVRTVGGVRVGIVGLTTPAVAFWEPPSKLAGLRFLDSVEAARREVALLRGAERCDFVIVLVHEGFERDPDTGYGRVRDFENQAYAIATEVAGIDLLLTGHTHRVLAPRRIGPVWVSQPGRFGETLTRFDVSFARGDAGAWTVAGVRGENRSMKSVVPDPEIVRIATPSHDAAMQELARPVARLPEAVSAAGARSRDTALLDWLHEVQRAAGRADLSFASLLPASAPTWPAGALTVRQVWAFYPYENTLVTLRATGRQVRDALEASARCVSGIEPSAEGPVWKRNADVWGYNCDTMDGADYALDPMRPEGESARLPAPRRGAAR